MRKSIYGANPLPLALIGTRTSPLENDGVPTAIVGPVLASATAACRRQPARARSPTASIKIDMTTSRRNFTRGLQRRGTAELDVVCA
jgi:hypothetical protein